MVAVVLDSIRFLPSHLEVLEVCAALIFLVSKNWENALYSFENSQIISGSLPRAIGKEFVTLIVYRESKGRRRMKLGKELATVTDVVELKTPFQSA